MEYGDEKIAALKKEQRRQKYRDIKGEGVFINDKLIKFCLQEVYDSIELYIPEDFIDMPEEVRLMKFPSICRPEIIFTSLDGSVNVAFSLVENQTPADQIESLTMQMKELIRKINPAAVFYRGESAFLASGAPICMFDFKNFGVDGQMYNMVCFTPLSCGTLHGTFICSHQDAEEWKDVAWEVFKTIQNIDSKE